MKIEVNGQAHDWAADLASLLEQMGLSDAHVATALNGEFVPAQRRETTALKAGDQVEVLAPMQGG
ncbi:sulfur carrier protein ThiS [Frateuria aurantia]|uniref:Thiamine biosynthesis protein ThiS n=1 Tax=Frateuria aurantia (strain ATCC 33424 / DSM 6220 / KCTC 2777 / LMG 1558 / NBRC 3245 / NCIMB 13370) TaxID=767434 RepID=H8L689_FRAAD|nr:sulfur carrier protein ThiS [Frateuria aurantia]AFC85935.1 thiamine biosynthesis protein ThiS [Frateuria aurantia DSM 6220]